jgi:hypothetical protein
VTRSLATPGRVWLTVAAIALGAAPASAQIVAGIDVETATNMHHAPASSSPIDPAAEALVARARVAAEPFRDRNAAILAGYRLVGTDFPSMGEHWISPRLVIEGQFDVARPAILTYITLDAHPVLTGVVYAVPLANGESPPTAFGPNAMWHLHSGTVDEESMQPIHDGSITNSADTRLAILHVWVNVANPGGLFAAENWALPFVRLGLSVPAAFPIGASRALSLLSVGSRYYLDLARGDEASAGSFTAVLSDCATAAAQIVHQAQAASRPLNKDDLRRLDEAWTEALRHVGSLSGLNTVKRINGGALPPGF